MPKDIYKFALYGVPGSGKTCLLSALAMPRVANPKRYTCTWIDKAPDESPPPEGPSGPPAGDPLQSSRIHLLKQIDLLKHGEPPDSTGTSQGVMSFLFDFTDPKLGVFRVEIADYSGELVLSEDKLAVKLREHMNGRDGLLILAETPKPKGDTAELAANLNALTAAFHQLDKDPGPGGRRDWPVAILLNKWDRRGPIDFTDPDGERRKMEEFLSGPDELPHKSLIDAVEGVVTADNLLIRPVSAFGAHEEGPDKKERPLLNGPMLRSFGLEDPFIELAIRRDEMELGQFLEAVSSCSPLKFWDWAVGRSPMSRINSADSVWNWLRGYSPLRCLRAGLRLRGRFGLAKESQAQLDKSLLAAGWKLVSQAALSVIAVVVGLLLFELVLDFKQHRRMGIDEGNPKLAAEAAREDEAWLQAYATSTGFRHIFAKRLLLSSAQASDRLKQFRSRDEEAAWAKVEQAADPRTKATHAEDYLKKYPQGAHVTEATALVDNKRVLDNLDYLTNAESELKNRTANDEETENALRAMLTRIDKLPQPSAANEKVIERQHSLRDLINGRLAEIAVAVAARQTAENLGFLGNLKGQIDALIGDNAEVERKLKDLLAQLDALPHPLVLDDKVAAEKGALSNHIFDRLKKIGVINDEEQWGAFRRQILDLLDRKLVREAAVQLNARVPDEPRLQGLREHFASRCVPTVTEEVELNLASHVWAPAREAWEKAYNDDDVKKLLPDEQIEALKKLESRINAEEDKYKYEQIKTNRGGTGVRSYVDQYLDTVRSGRMVEAVSKYKAHLDRMDGPLKLKLALEGIDWGKGAADGYVHAVTVKVDGTPRIEQDVKAHPLKHSGRIGDPIEIEKSRTQPVSIAVKVVRKPTWIWGQADAGEGDIIIPRVEDLLLGKEVGLAGDGQTHKATFKVTGFPPEPPLPPWGEE